MKRIYITNVYVFNRFYFHWAGQDYSLGFSISHVTFWEVTSVWGVSAVAILDCLLNVYACGRQKALTMPAYCVATNCNNSQATQNIIMHEFPQNRPAVMRKWIKFVHFKRADFDGAPHHAHLCSERFAEYDFANFLEYRIPKRNLKPTAFPSVQKAGFRTPGKKRNYKRKCEADFQQ